MGAGYTRQSEENIVDEAVINADDFNAEFDQIESAFNATTGHTHDGTEGEGPKIDTAGLADDAVTGAKIDSTTTVTAASFVGPLTGNADSATTLTGVTATATELNKLDGATITTTELNYLDGATSNIQDQIDNIDTGNFVTGSSSGEITGRIPVFTDDTGFAIQSSDASGAPEYLRVNDGYLAITGNGITLGDYGISGPDSTGTGVIRIGDGAGDNASGTGSIYISLFRSGREATGSYNIGMGDFALYDSAFTGDHNIALGFNAGYSIESGNNNICIGRYAGWTISPSGTITNADSNIICLGDDDIAEAYVAVAWTVPSDARDKTDFEDLNVGLNFINRVEPKTFHYDHRSAYYVFDENNEIVSKPTPDGTHKTDRKFLGFSAQQVQEAVEASGLPDQIIIDTSDPDAYKMKETAFIPVLVKAVQELSARVEQLEAQLNNT